MCGIGGIVSANQIEARALAGMAQSVRHRGPDGEGYVFFGGSNVVCLGGADTQRSVFELPAAHRPIGLIDSQQDLGGAPHIAFAHRRLAILDLSPSGHQPMSYLDGRYWIIYNGEIYNHVELRDALQAEGYRFNSRSDTEVLLAAYARWGKSCLSRLNGMWALAIYDREQNELFLARDRFGEKPLYYWRAPDHMFAFASEIKQFTHLPGWAPRVNGQRAYDFLVYGLMDATDETMFQGVFQLLPGHRAILSPERVLSIAAGTRIPSERWYTPEPTQFSGGFEAAAVEFRERLVDSVRLRLRADVPIGSCLSGGLDSSSIVCTIRKLLGEGRAEGQQKTFSACSTVDLFDERKWVDIVVAETKVDAHVIYPSFDALLDDFFRITWHQDEPFGSTSIYAQWSVFKEAAASGVKVVLDGQGADEYLYGYPVFFGARLASLLKARRLLELCREALAIRRMHGLSARDFVRYVAPHILPHGVDAILRYAGGGPKPSTWLNLTALRAAPINPLHAHGLYKGSMAAMAESMLTSLSLPMLLHWEDRDSMAHGIEARVPFLDHRLVEFVTGLPDDSKLQRGVTKRVLRRAMRNILPKSIAERRDKLGFVTPESVWLRGVAREEFTARCEKCVKAAGEIFKVSETMGVVSRILDGAAPFSFLPWRIASFGQWIDTYSVTT
jgi:asparagine synthase (glutamine-hydrolysing)